MYDLAPYAIIPPTTGTLDINYPNIFIPTPVFIGFNEVHSVIRFPIFTKSF